MIRLLGAIFWLQHRTYRNAFHLNQLIDALDRDLSTYYGEIPINSVDLNYLGTTEAGTYYGRLGPQIYEKLHKTYASLMYEPFDMDDLPQVVRDAEEKATEAGEHFLGWLPDEHNPDGPQKLRVMPDYAAALLNNDFKTQMESMKWEASKKELQKFIAERSMSEQEFRDRIADRRPGLATLLDHIDSTAAQGFELSIVGIMIAQQEISGRSPEAAAQIDSYIGDDPA
jgi:hypothetical protein